MLPTRLEIKNFLAYRSPDALIFEGIHLACLTGPNGAGKSSLLDAITWALWGKARAKRDEELVHLGQNDMSVQLDFEQGGFQYRVLRRRTRKGGGAGTLNLFARLEDGSWNEISQPIMRATQAKIVDLLKLDYETFVHSAFLQQGKADAFTTKTPRERKQLLADILGLDRWEKYEEAVKAQLKQIDEEMIGFQTTLRDIEQELLNEPQYQAELAAAEAVQQEAQAALQEAEKLFEEVAHAEKDLRAALERKAALEQHRSQNTRELTATAVEIERQQARITAFEDVIAAKDDIEHGYAALQEARETYHDLGDKLRQLSGVDEQRRVIERELETLRSELKSKVSGIKANNVGLERTIALAQPDEMYELQAEIDALEALEAQRDDLRDEVSAMDNERTELTTLNRSLRDEMNVLKRRQDQLGEASGAVCPLCGQPLDADARDSLIDQLQIEGTGKGETFRANAARVEEIENLLKSHRSEIVEAERELRRLAALKERGAVLQAAIETAQTAERDLIEQQAQLNELQHQLDDELFGADLREQMAALDAQRAELGYDSTLHNSAREDIDTYKEYETRQRELETAEHSLPDAQAALAASRERHERTAAAQAQLETDYAALLEEITALDALKQEQQQREQEVNQLRLAERKAQQKLGSALQQISSLDSLRGRQAELEARRAVLREEQSLYDELRVAFGKKGIPAMIIESAIPELEVGANRMLSRMTDGRMSLKLETQREKVTGGVAETLDIHIADELGTRSYEMYSGGEAFRINFALRVALSQMLARRAGAQLRTLFLDEGFGTQDDDGRNKLIEAITAIQDDFDMILVITHIDELRDSFPVHIVVDKLSEGSRIQLR
jgi:exonuclease SbcC